MVDRIERLYDQPRPEPIKPAPDARPERVEDEKRPEEERGDGRVRRENVAERIAPQLRDEVEISEEARRASEAERVERGAFVETGVPDEVARRLEESWYSAGYREAMELQDRAREVGS